MTDAVSVVVDAAMRYVRFVVRYINSYGVRGWIAYILIVFILAVLFGGAK